MDITTLTELFTSLGVPAALIVVLVFLVWQMGKQLMAQADKNMEQVQARCKEREEILYAEIKESREVNEKAIDTIARYAEKLDVIQTDVKEIKSDVSILMGATQHNPSG